MLGPGVWEGTWYVHLLPGTINCAPVTTVSNHSHSECCHRSMRSLRLGSSVTRNPASAHPFWRPCQGYQREGRVPVVPVVGRCQCPTRSSSRR